MKLAIEILAALLLIASASGQTATSAQTTLWNCTQTYASDGSKANPSKLVLNPTAKTVTTVAFFDGSSHSTTDPATFTAIAITWKESGMGITETNILNPMTGILTSTVTNGLRFNYRCQAAAK